MKGKQCSGSVQIHPWLAQNIRKASATQGKDIPHKMLRPMDPCLQKADIRLFQSCQPSADKPMDPWVASTLALSTYAEFGRTDTGKHVADPAALPTCFQTHVPSGLGPALLGSVPEHKEWTFVSCH